MKNFKALMLLLILFFFWTGPENVFAISEEDPEKQSGFLEEIPEWQARLELARLLGYTGRYQESVEQYRQVIQEKPDLMEARLELARVLYWKGDTLEAEEMFASVPDEDLSPKARLEMADIYVARQEYDSAVKIYQDHLHKNPGDEEVRFKLAQVLSWQGDYEASISQYRRVLQDRPQDVQVRRKYAQVLIWAERFDEAISQLEKTLED